MIPKKHKQKVYGGHMSLAERKAMEIEINKQIIERSENHDIELISIFLWTLKERRGYGPKRLKETYDDIKEEIDKLLERYSLEGEDTPWLCTEKLKELGIDIKKWEKESNV